MGTHDLLSSHAFFCPKKKSSHVFLLENVIEVEQVTLSLLGKRQRLSLSTPKHDLFQENKKNNI